MNNKLFHTAGARRLALFILFLCFEGWMATVGSLRPEATLTPFEWVLLAFAGTLGGAGVAYLGIGEWLRFPLVKVTPHPCGVGEYTEPKFKGALEAIGLLLSCPICSGTWVAAGLYTLHAFFPAQATPMLYVMAAGGALSILVRIRELVERVEGLAWEQTGLVHKQSIPPAVADCPSGVIGNVHEQGEWGLQ